MASMAVDAQASSYSGREEIASSVIHGLGIVLSIAGLALLVAIAAQVGQARHKDRKSVV